MPERQLSALETRAWAHALLRKGLQTLASWRAGPPWARLPGLGAGQNLLEPPAATRRAPFRWDTLESLMTRSAPSLHEHGQRTIDTLILCRVQHLLHDETLSMTSQLSQVIPVLFAGLLVFSIHAACFFYSWRLEPLKALPPSPTCTPSPQSAVCPHDSPGGGRPASVHGEGSRAESCRPGLPRASARE